jgi:hypothetical protein
MGNKKTGIQASLGINMRSYLKKTKMKKVGKVAQVVEHLKSCIQTPGPPKKKKVTIYNIVKFKLLGWRHDSSGKVSA